MFVDFVVGMRETHLQLRSGNRVGDGITVRLLKLSASTHTSDERLMLWCK